LGRRKIKGGNHKRREPNGKLSRRIEDTAARHLKEVDSLEQEERAMLHAGVSARIRVLGVAPEDSRDQFAGSFVGRLFLGGQITRQQLEAAQIYFSECANHTRVTGAPKAPGAVDLNATHGSSGDIEDVEQVRRIVDRYKSARAAVTEKQIECRGFANLFGALSVCVLMDKPATNLIGDLRLGLGALARHYKLERSKAA